MRRIKTQQGLCARVREGEDCEHDRELFLLNDIERFHLFILVRFYSLDLHGFDSFILCFYSIILDKIFLSTYLPHIRKANTLFIVCSPCITLSYD